MRARAATCECGHPWFDHDSRGCGVDSFLDGPCPCKVTGPVREESGQGDLENFDRARDERHEAELERREG
jgi:hypothetical protein